MKNVIALCVSMIPLAAQAEVPTQPVPGSRVDMVSSPNDGQASSVHFCDGGRVIYAQATNGSGHTVKVVFVDEAGKPASAAPVGVRLDKGSSPGGEVRFVCMR